MSRNVSNSCSALPDYRWVVEEQQICLRPKDLGLEERISFSPEGLTFARNGDLLMAACSPEAGKTFIMRSADRGKTWKQQGVLEHRGEGEFGCVEGMVMTKSGRLVMFYYILKQETESVRPGWPYYVPGGATSASQSSVRSSGGSIPTTKARRGVGCRWTLVRFNPWTPKRAARSSRRKTALSWRPSEGTRPRRSWTRASAPMASFVHTTAV
jgi:hypothetical protein